MPALAGSLFNEQYAHDPLFSKSMVFDSWVPIMRVLLVGTLNYAVVVALLHYFGNHPLTRLNAFPRSSTNSAGKLPPPSSQRNSSVRP